MAHEQAVVQGVHTQGVVRVVPNRTVHKNVVFPAAQVLCAQAQR